MVPVLGCSTRLVAARSSSASGVGRVISAHPARLKLAAQRRPGRLAQLIRRPGSCSRRVSGDRSQVVVAEPGHAPGAVPSGRRSGGRPGHLRGRARPRRRGRGAGARWRSWLCTVRLSSLADQLAVGVAGRAGRGLAFGGGRVVFQQRGQPQEVGAPVLRPRRRVDRAAQFVQGAVQPGQAGQVPAGRDRVAAGQAVQERGGARLARRAERAVARSPGTPRSRYPACRPPAPGPCPASPA